METMNLLLPIGQTIDLHGKALRVIKILSSVGLTSEVYQGELEDEEILTSVAIKAMKPLVFASDAEAKKSFEVEAMTLRNLEIQEDARVAEENSGKTPEQQIFFHTAPKYYGYGDYQGTPIIVMELVTGKPMLELLSEDGPLPEPKAIKAAWQLFRILDILHSCMNLTYRDLKFEDLWWVDSEDGSLKMTDFGTMESIRPGEAGRSAVRKDVLLASVHFLSMISQRYLTIKEGELKERADERLNDIDISWGTKNLLRKLLHRHPDRRMVNAADVCTELENLWNYWTWPIQELQLTASKNLLKAQEAATKAHSDLSTIHTFAARAHAMYDIVIRRAPERAQDFVDDVQQAEDYITRSGYETRGRSLFNGGSYKEARVVFEEGIDWSDDPATLRRWTYAALIGEELGTEQFKLIEKEVVEIVELLKERHIEHAQERLKLLKSNLPESTAILDGLLALEADCELSTNLRTAQDCIQKEDWTGAASAYRQAMEALSRLPDKRRVEREETGDLRARTELMDTIRDSQGKSRGFMDQAKFLAGEGDWNAALQAADQSLDAFVDESYSEILATMTLLAIRNGQFDVANRFSAQGLNAGLHTAELIRLNRQSYCLNAAQNALNGGNLLLLATWLEKTPSERESDMDIVSAITKMIRRGFLERPVTLSIHESQAVEDLLAHIHGSGTVLSELTIRLQKEKEARQINLHQRTEELYQQAAELFSRENPSNLRIMEQHFSLIERMSLLTNRIDRLGVAANLLKQASILTNNSDQQQRINDLSTKVQEELSIRLSEKDRRTAEVEPKRQQSINSIEQLTERFKQFENWALGSSKVDATPEIINGLKQQREILLSNLINSCLRHIAEIDNDDPQVLALLEKMVGLAYEQSPQAWHTIVAKEQEEIEIRKGKLFQLQQDFEKGKANELFKPLLSLLPYLSTWPEYEEMVEKWFSQYALKDWENKCILQFSRGQFDANLLTELRGYLKMQIPEIYWHGSSALQYLAKVNTVTHQNVERLLGNKNDPSFVIRLREWVDTELTVRLAGSLMRKI